MKRMSEINSIMKNTVKKYSKTKIRYRVFIYCLLSLSEKSRIIYLFQPYNIKIRGAMFLFMESVCHFNFHFATRKDLKFSKTKIWSRNGI